MQLSAQNAAGRRGGGGWRRGKRREREGGVGRQKDSGKKVGQRQKSEREKTDAKRTGKGERRKGATRGERCRESRDRVGGTETETEAKWRGRGRGERRKGATREVRGERLQGVEGVAVKALVRPRLHPHAAVFPRGRPAGRVGNGLGLRVGAARGDVVRTAVGRGKAQGDVAGATGVEQREGVLESLSTPASGASAMRRRSRRTGIGCGEAARAAGGWVLGRSVRAIKEAQVAPR